MKKWLHHLITYLSQRRRQIIEICFLGLIACISLLWFDGRHEIIGHDTGFRFDLKTYYEQLKYPWSESVNFGYDWSLYRGFLTVQLPELIAFLFVSNLAMAQPLVTFFWSFSLLFGMYFLLTRIFPEKHNSLIRILGSVMYGLNFYLLQGWTIFERAKFSLYCLLPVSFLLIWKSTTGKWNPWIAAILFGMAYGLMNGGGSPPLYGASLVLWFSTFFFFGILAFRKNRVSGLFRVIGIGLLFAVSFLLFNAFWIIPQIELFRGSFGQGLGSEGGVAGLLNWEGEISKNASWINLLRLQGIPDWYSVGHPFSQTILNHPLAILLSFVPIVLLMLGIWLKIWRNVRSEIQPIVWLLLGLLPVSLFFSAGTHPPLGFMYTLMMEYLPGFLIFRSSFYKFMPLTLFIITVLMTIVIAWIVQRITNPKKRVLVGLLILFCWLGYHWPYFSAHFFQISPTISTRLVVPEYVRESVDYLEKQLSSTDRVLLLPPPNTERIGEPIDIADWGYYSLSFLPRIATNKNFISSDDPGGQVAQVLYHLLLDGNLEQFQKLCQRFGITHILYRDDVISDEKNNVLKTLVDDNFTIVYTNQAWQLYQLSNINASQFTYFPTVQVVASASDQQTLLYASTNQLPIISDTLQLPSLNYISRSLAAECYLCKTGEYSALVKAISLPQPKTKLSKFKASIKSLIRPQSNMALSGGQLIDQRLSDILWLLVDPDQAELEAQLGLFTDTINTEFQKLEVRERVIYANRLAVYFDFFRTNQQFLSVETVTLPLQQTIKNAVWYASEDYFRYGIMIDQPGEYDLVLPDSKQDREILINNQNMQFPRILETGFYKVAVERFETDNLAPTIILELKTGELRDSTASVQVIKRNPTEYQVSLTTEEDGLLVFNQLFDQRWMIKNMDLKHLLVNNTVNGWILPKGKHDLEVVYKTQTNYRVGLIVSLFAYGSGVVILILSLINRLRRQRT